MDWQRAQTYLITTFILVNLFLLFQIQQTMEQKNASLAVDKITDKQIKTLLAENEIELDVPTPKDVSELKIWQGTISTINGWQEIDHGFQKRFAKNTKIIQTSEELIAWLTKEVPYFSQYQLLSRPKDLSGKWVFVQQLNKRPIYDGRIEVQLENNQVRSIYLLHFQLQQTSNIVTLTDFNTALYNLINYATSNKPQRIKQVQLGYRSQIYNDGSYFFIPVWRFQLDDKQYDVHAVSFGSVKSVEVVQ
jgi:regulatory protein YycI of two-component signal transduction system YycFG